MYINYLSDRKNLGFSTIKDIEAGEKLVAVTNKVFVITIIGMHIYFISPDTFKNFEMLKTQNPEVVKIINISGEADDCPQKIIGPNLYVSILDEYRPSRLYMSNFERPSHISSYDSQEVINKLRAGDLSLTQAAWLFITIWMLRQQSMGFQPARQVPPPPHRQLFGGTSSLPPNNYFSKSGQTSASLQMNRPSAMPHQEYTSLTKEQKRNLPHPKDRFINVEGHQQLVLGYGQVGFKTPDHGEVHDLPVNENSKIPKIEENIDALMD